MGVDVCARTHAEASGGGEGYAGISEAAAALVLETAGMTWQHITQGVAGNLLSAGLNRDAAGKGSLTEADRGAPLNGVDSARPPQPLTPDGTAGKARVGAFAATVRAAAPNDGGQGMNWCDHPRHAAGRGRHALAGAVGAGAIPPAPLPPALIL